MRITTTVGEGYTRGASAPRVVVDPTSEGVKGRWMATATLARSDQGAATVKLRPHEPHELVVTPLRLVAG